MHDPVPAASEPTLADDEQKLAAYADALLDAAQLAVGPWIRRSIERFDADLALSETAADAVEAGHTAVTQELRALLQADIDDQREGPLQVLRRGVRFASAVLAAAGVDPPPRDEFAERAFPDDHYDLAPASFADIDPALHEPGLVWGAAKAHVHLRRRREATQ